MSLDLLALSGQVRDMARAVGGDSSSLHERILVTQRILEAESATWETWHEQVEKSRLKQAWLFANPLEPLSTVYPLPDKPRIYAVAASDGSHIDVERHGIADYWLINVGRVSLVYGEDASFKAESVPTLGYRSNELVLNDSRSDQEAHVTGPVLAAYRDLFEGLRLADLVSSLPSDRTKIALFDGTLIRWTLNSFENWLKNRFLQEQFTYFDGLLNLACPLASYISRPRSSDVVGLVQFTMVEGDTSKWKTLYPQRVDSPLRGVNDNLLFDRILRDGERSARFQSMSRINVDSYPSEHKIQFFYLKVGREIARVEFPAWVGDGDLDLVHSLIYDQCQRGMGYPVALQRAHEQAVIHDGDRRQVEALIERIFATEAVPTQRSAKSVTKLRPGL